MKVYVCMLSLLLSLGVGCSWDNRKKVAYLTLVNKEDKSPAFDEETYTAAIQTRFPIGSPAEKFIAYIESAQGKCIDNERHQGRFHCEIPTRAGVCWAELIGFDIGVSENILKDMRIFFGGIGC